MTVLNPDSYEHRRFMAELEWHIDRQRRFKRAERIFLGVAVAFGLLAVCAAASGIANALICYKVGCA